MRSRGNANICLRREMIGCIDESTASDQPEGVQNDGGACSEPEQRQSRPHADPHPWLSMCGSDLPFITGSKRQKNIRKRGERRGLSGSIQIIIAAAWQRNWELPRVPDAQY